VDNALSDAATTYMMNIDSNPEPKIAPSPPMESPKTKKVQVLFH
jgi:hypothetical protein